MTRDELLALPPTIDIDTARRPLGLGRTKAYEMRAAGTFPVKVLQLGCRYRVITADLWALLGVTPNSVSGGLPRQETAAETHVTADTDWSNYAPNTPSG
jgi:hypothetical protein